MTTINNDFSTSVSQFVTSWREIQDFHNSVGPQMSACDKEVNTLYHILEIKPMNAVEQAKVAKKLRATLQKRRELKQKLAYAQSIMESMPSTNFRQRVEKVARQEKQNMQAYMEEAQESYEKIFKEE